MSFLSQVGKQKWKSFIKPICGKEQRQKLRDEVGNPGWMGPQQSSRSCLQSDLSTVCFKCIWVTFYWKIFQTIPLQYIYNTWNLIIIVTYINKKRFWVNFETHCRSLMDRWCRECRSAELKGFYLKKIKSKKRDKMFSCFISSFVQIRVSICFDKSL